MKTKYASPAGKWEDDSEHCASLEPLGREQELLSDDELIAHYRSLRSDVIRNAQGLKVNSDAERVHRATINRYTECINELEVKVYFHSKFAPLKKGGP
jgi:hypothetical protein